MTSIGLSVKPWPTGFVRVHNAAVSTREHVGGGCGCSHLAAGHDRPAERDGAADPHCQGRDKQRSTEMAEFSSNLCLAAEEVKRRKVRNRRPGDVGAGV